MRKSGDCFLQLASCCWQQETARPSGLIRKHEFLVQVARPTLFNTPEADAVVSAMQIMPVTNPWNEDVSQRPRLANSDAMIAQIKSDLVSGVNGQTGVALVETYHLP
jgi:hypothetical protein